MKLKYFFFSFFLFFPFNSVLAITYFADGFETYSDGQLNLQGGWFAPSDVEIVSFGAYAGTRAVLGESTSGGSIIRHGIPDLSNPPYIDFSFWTRWQDLTGNQNLNFRLKNVATSTTIASGNRVCEFSYDFDDDDYLLTSGTESGTGQNGRATGTVSLPFNTWFNARMQVDLSANTCWVEANSWTSTVIPIANSITNTLTLEIVDEANNDAGGTFYDNVFVNGQPGDTSVATSTSPYNSYINWLSPIISTASTTFDVVFEYYMEQGEFQNGTLLGNILIQVCPLGYTNQLQGDCITKTYEESPQVGVLTTATTSITVISEGYSIGLINYWNGVEETDECSWWQLFCDDEYPILGAGDTQRFNVATDTIMADSALVASLSGNYGSFCESLDVSFDVVAIGLCKVLLFLFSPASEVTGTFMTLKLDMQTKLPFAPLFVVLEQIAILSSTQPNAGEDLVLNLWDTEVTMFSFTEARSGLDELIYSDTVEDTFGYVYLMMIAWYYWTRLSGRGKGLFDDGVGDFVVNNPRGV